MTILVLGILFVCIGLLSYYSSLYGGQGILTESDFLLYYIHHSWEINTFLFVSAIVLLLYIFVTIFFRNMNVLLATMQGIQKNKVPWNFKLLPQFQLAKEKVEEMVRKKNETQELSIQEKEHKNELLMYLAHDLKTPLTSMIGYINHILDHHIDAQQQETSIHIAYEKAKRLDDLIDEFSEILRYDDKVSLLDLSKIDLPQLLNQQLAGFYPLMEKRGIKWKIDLPEGAFITGDYDKLLRVFDNLMRNAIAYSNANSTIEISGIMKDRTLCLTYQNESEEIDEEAIAHLFDKFYRANTARSSSSGGAGLGLAIAKEIVELHHGVIQAHAEGNHILFTIDLPYEQGVYE